MATKKPAPKPAAVKPVRPADTQAAADPVPASAPKAATEPDAFHGKGGRFVVIDGVRRKVQPDE